MLPVSWITFERHLIYKAHRKESTLPACKRVFETISSYFKNKPFDEKSVFDFFDHLKSKGDKNSTINNYLKYLHHLGKILKQPWLNEIRYFPLESLHFDTLTEKEVVDIVNFHPHRQRDEVKHNEFWDCLLSLMFLTGMRRNEVISLKWEDMQDNKLWIQHSKGRRARMVKISPNLGIRIQGLAHYPHGYIFGTANGKITPQRINDELKNRARLLGIKKKISSHTIRRTVATLLATKVNIKFIQDLLGHKNLNTTSQYIQFDEKQLDECIRSLPLGKDMLNIDYIQEVLTRTLQSFTPDYRYNFRKKGNSLFFDIHKC